MTSGTTVSLGSTASGQGTRKRKSRITRQGWVGEVYVRVTAKCIAPGQYTAQFDVDASWKTLPWSATDGNLTLLPDGVLQVQYPSYSIREYWTRVDGRGREILATAKRRNEHSVRSSSQTNNGNIAKTGIQTRRKIMVVFRFFGANKSNTDRLQWHWAIGIDDRYAPVEIYEVSGSMAVVGPKGTVAASSIFVAPVNTKLDQFDGYLDMPSHTTTKSDEEVVSFCRSWVKGHPMYRIEGPNCQTFAEDLFTFLTGEDLPFKKTIHKVAGGAPVGDNSGGPEASSSAVWLDPSKKPKW